MLDTPAKMNMDSEDLLKIRQIVVSHSRLFVARKLDNFIQSLYNKQEKTEVRFIGSECAPEQNFCLVCTVVGGWL